MKERAEIMTCEDAALVGILHEPDIIGPTGLVIIVAGGPQYRVGAHRQFVMLARQLAAAGIPVIRFDHRGTGDSDGDYRGFMDMDADIRTAVDTLFSNYPTLEQAALWGECESASAAAYYAHTDKRISGIFLVNPWVRTEAGLAKTYLKHHYRSRLVDPEFWKKVRSGQFSVSQSLRSLLGLVMEAAGGRDSKEAPGGAAAAHDLPLTVRLEKSLLSFHGDIAVLTSGRDHIAQEYKDFANSSKALRRHLNQPSSFVYEVADSDHTFSRPEWRNELFTQTEFWLTRLNTKQAGKKMRVDNNELSADYRDSHQQRGDSYDEFISSSPADAYMDKWEALSLKEILARLLDGRKIGRYMDFACGTGRITKVMEAYATESIGVDISESMIARARENTASTSFVHADLTREDPELGIFDVVSSFRFFGNAQDDLRHDALKAITRYLDVGGLLIINNHRNPNALKTLLFSLGGGSHDLDLTHAKLKEILASHGFQIVMCRTIGFWLFRDALASTVALDSWYSRVFESIFKFGLFSRFSQDTIVVARKVA
jgi:exosortase A-associated hydrolase 1